MSLRTTPIDGLRTYYLRGQNFKICINITEKPLSLLEDKNQRWRTSHYYAVYGKGKLFDNNDPTNCQILTPKTIINVEKYMECGAVMYESEEPTEIIGFNSEYHNDRWDAELINIDQTSIICESTSVIICFNGSMFVNDKEFQKYNFARLKVGEEYKLNLNETSEVGLFKLIV